MRGGRGGKVERGGKKEEEKNKNKSEEKGVGAVRAP